MVVSVWSLFLSNERFCCLCLPTLMTAYIGYKHRFKFKICLPDAALTACVAYRVKVEHCTDAEKVSNSWTLPFEVCVLKLLEQTAAMRLL